MATYSLTQQPYSIQNIGYSDQSGGGGSDYQQSSLYSFLDPNAPVFFGNAASITVNFSGGQWYINIFDTNASFMTFFIVDRLDYSDADHLVFSDGNFEYVISDAPINYASPVSIPDDSSIPGDYQPGLVNTAPTDITGGPFSAAENTANGTIIGSVTGQDPQNDTLTYSLVDDAGGRFAIDSITGQLTVANGSLLDFESNTSHSVTVRVTDAGDLTFDKGFTIAVSDVNEAPTNIGLANASVAENSANGTVVGALSDVDQDAGDSATFTLVDDAGGRFAISGTNLVVANGGLLDFESNTSHSVTVRVTDSGGLTFDKIFNIAVAGLNEAPTDIALSHASIAENSVNGTVVGSLSDVDPDAGDSAAFTLVDDAGGRFAISGSNLVVANGGLLDFEQHTSHSVTVRVTDSGGLTYDKAFNIAVSNINDAPTNITLSHASIAENSFNGAVVGTLSDVDQDAGDSAAFTLVDDAGGRFAINGTNLVVADGSKLDFESNTSHSVTVRATDSGGLTFDKAFNIAVADVSDIDPNAKPHWIKSVYTPPHPAGWSPTQVADFNADGTSDVAWYHAATGNVDIWKFQDGQWSASVDVGSHPAGYQPAGSGDFNHDGTSDLIWFNPATRDVDLWKMSDGHWAGSVDIGTHPAGYQPSLTGDFTGDGTADVLWYNASTRDTEIWKIANGQWAASLDVGLHPAGYQPALAGDFNGDGTSDVAWYNAASGDVDIWKMANGQWTGSVGVGPHPAGWQPLGAADFNRDGTSDIVWYNPASNNVDVWLMKNGQWSASVNIGSHPAGAAAVGVGDFDHNGVSDIMWQDTATGFIDNWLLAYS
jgi:hypothetical protein